MKLSIFAQFNRTKCTSTDNIFTWIRPFALCARSAAARAVVPEDGGGWLAPYHRDVLPRYYSATRRLSHRSCLFSLCCQPRRTGTQEPTAVVDAHHSSACPHIADADLEELPPLIGRRIGWQGLGCMSEGTNWSGIESGMFPVPARIGGQRLKRG